MRWLLASQARGYTNKCSGELMLMSFVLINQFMPKVAREEEYPSLRKIPS